MSENNGTIDGSGWMVGPYFVTRHDNRSLYFEGRLLYGQSDNDIRFNDLISEQEPGLLILIGRLRNCEWREIFPYQAELMARA